MMYQFYIENLMFSEYGENPYMIYIDPEDVEEEIKEIDMTDADIEDLK